MVECCHRMVSLWQSTTRRSPSLSRSNTWPLGSSWKPSALLSLVFELRRYPPSDAVLTPVISPITGRLVEGENVVFLPIQVQKNLPTAQFIQYATPPLQTSMCHIRCRFKRVRTRVVVVVVRELLFLVTSVICVRIRGRGQRLPQLLTTFV